MIHFLWDMRKFYDGIKAHLLIPQLVARGYPLEILVLGSLTHKSPRCLQVGNGDSDMVNGCASSILAGCLQSCSWARGLLFELVQALGFLVPGSVCEEHIDDLLHFVTNTSHMQLFQDVALIGKAVKEGTAKLGLTLSGISTLLANDKSLGKLIVGHLGDEDVPICLGTSATDLGIETAAANQWETHMERQTRVNRLCKISSEAQKLTMTGIHLVQIYGHTAQGASTAQVNAMCKSLKVGTVMGKRAPFPRSHGSSAKNECHKLAPELNKSASGSQCGEVSMSTQGADFVRSGGRRLSIWQKTPDAGTKLQAQSLPPCARCWRRAGSRAHQGSGKRQTRRFCSTRRRSSTVSPKNQSR